MGEMKKPNFLAIEKKWQNRWGKNKIFHAKEKGQKYYVLEMFPYPSASGLHMGHALNYTIGDIYARFKRMSGFNVLYPMGFDSLGLPAENAAIQEKIHPKQYTEKAIKNYTKQMKELGLSYDWTRIVVTHEPEYYKWDQWIFLKMYEKGLAYRKKAPVNYCPDCKTVLANEQVHDGKCWRHRNTNVEIKHLEQWFLKITDYGEELNSGLEKLKQWPEMIKKLQKNWIGKSYGSEISFSVNGEPWKIFTTRPDTIYGVTFMVISCQHPRLMELVTERHKHDVEKFLKRIKSVSEKELDELEKDGVFTGSYAVNPINNEKIPIYAGNFVVADYGSGMVMAVPGHDQRDFEFAKKYDLAIKEVIKGGNIEERAYTDKGVLVNSGEFNGMDNETAKIKITEFLEEKKLAGKSVQFRLKDWLISRQRYWGTPIPIIYCDNCGIVPVAEKDLPVKLPEKVKFGEGNPLTTNEKFVNVKCPKCRKKARRETDTMDTFVNSSWYFLRYADNKNKKEIFDRKKVDYWMPIDTYIGGKEHACMHLIYFRFYTKFLRDIGLLKIDEPAVRLFNQGILHGNDGEKMSKSRGNVVLPEKVSEKYGIDSARLFLVSVASQDKDIVWSEKGIEGSLRFINKVMNYFKNVKTGKSGRKITSRHNKTVKEITEDIENFQYNTAVIKLRGLFDKISESKEQGKEILSGFLKMFSVFCPHIAEELWEKIKGKGFVSISDWPKCDGSKIDKKLEEEEMLIDKLIEDINHIIKIVAEKGKKVCRAVIYSIPSEKDVYFSAIGEIERKTGLTVSIYSVGDKEKYDPENKSRKAGKGKPAIFLE